ncbi:MAG: hypothetical protein AAF990_19735 [Bacteroidota bacterium]
MRLLQSFCLTILAVGLLLTGCKKDDTQPQSDYQSASDLLAAETVFDEIFALTDGESKQQGDLNGVVSNGPKAQDRGCMSIDLATAAAWPNIFPITLTLDFGDACTVVDGSKISGKIVTVYTGKLQDKGTTATLSLEDFEINGYKVSGRKVWTNNGLNDNGQFHYTVEVKNGEVTTPDGTLIRYETNNTRTWIEGMDTNFWTNGVEGITDDVWEVTGTASGLNRRGESYVATIESPWRHQADCQWLTSGVTKVVTTGLASPISLDFGDGNCDNKATVTVGNFTTEIEL